MGLFMCLKHRDKDHLQSSEYLQYFITTLFKACLEPEQL